MVTLNLRTLEQFAPSHYRFDANTTSEFPKMLTAIVLVCSLAVTPDLRECGRENAVHVLQVPEEFAAPAMCAMRGQSFLAETSIGQTLSNNERVKVMCVRHLSPGHRIG
jgi:hypothetical protein